MYALTCGTRCDLSRPCQTCRDRDHPELCSYHPPNKRQQGEAGHPILKLEEGAAGPSMVTLGRAEFDMLCSKLNGLENSIADLRRELSRNSQQNGHVGFDATADAHYIHPASVQDHQEPIARPPTHTDVHGIHTRNDAGEIVHFGMDRKLRQCPRR
jgi:hypothetical protein